MKKYLFPLIHLFLANGALFAMVAFQTTRRTTSLSESITIHTIEDVFSVYTSDFTADWGDGTAPEHFTGAELEAYRGETLEQLNIRGYVANDKLIDLEPILQNITLS